jgi:hypothetical protein
LENAFQKYLLTLVILLTVFLTFQTGNIGLILRQKTIMMPFIFLLVLYGQRRMIIPSNDLKIHATN